MVALPAESFIIRRPFPPAFNRHLREAVETLGYYRRPALPRLAAMYRRAWSKGLSSSMFRIDEIKPLMTEKGLADPYHAQKATFLRAQFNLRREEFDQQEPEWSRLASHVSFAARAQWLCDRARELDGTVAEAASRWSLPLPECGQEWCPCRWDYVLDSL